MSFLSTENNKTLQVLNKLNLGELLIPTAQNLCQFGITDANISFQCFIYFLST